MKTEVFNAFNPPGLLGTREIVDFLYEHLDTVNDSRADIERAVRYAVKESASFGGFVITNREGGELVGVLVMNQTGMKGYIPENILVYIVTHKKYRRQGVGKQMLEQAIRLADGNVACHLESGNPARFLYEKAGFKQQYFELRLNKESN